MPNFKRRKLKANKQRIKKYKQNKPTTVQSIDSSDEVISHTQLPILVTNKKVVKRSPINNASSSETTIIYLPNQITKQNSKHEQTTVSTINKIDLAQAAKTDQSLINPREHSHTTHNALTESIQSPSYITANKNFQSEKHKVKKQAELNSKAIQSQPSPDTNSIPNYLTEISNKQQFRFVFITLTAAILTGYWLMHQSIQTYYQQTYHRDLPEAEMITNNTKEQIDSSLNSLLNKLHHFNERLINNFNENHVYTPAYKQLLAQQHQQHLAEQTALAEKERQLSKQAKLKADFTLSNTDQVFFAGDSLMQGVAPFVQKWLNEQHQIKSVNLSRQSTGLTYPGFFNWPQTIIDTLTNNPQIKILVIYLGPNDPWNMPNPSGGPFLHFKSPEWEAIYRNRIKTIIDTAHQYEVTVLWLTPPDVRRTKLNEQMIYLRDLIQDEVSRNQGYTMDTRMILGSQNNQFSDSITTNNGNKIKTRSADGIHFSIAGQKILAKAIFDRFIFQQNKDK